MDKDKYVFLIGIKGYSLFFGGLFGKDEKPTPNKLQNIVEAPKPVLSPSDTGSTNSASQKEKKKIDPYAEFNFLMDWVKT